MFLDFLADIKQLIRKREYAGVRSVCMLESAACGSTDHVSCVNDVERSLSFTTIYGKLPLVYP